MAQYRTLNSRVERSGFGQERSFDGQISGKSVAIVLIGSKAASQKWIKYEIKKAWGNSSGVLGIYVHNLNHRDRNQPSKGRNPFHYLALEDREMSPDIKTCNHSYITTIYVCDHLTTTIKEELANWVEKAIEVRGNYD